MNAKLNQLLDELDQDIRTKTKRHTTYQMQRNLLDSHMEKEQKEIHQLTELKTHLKNALK